MACEVVQLPGGAKAIVCGTRRHKARCRCGRAAPLLCDWKVEGMEKVTTTGTCDRPLCSACSTSPAPGKDLCPEHAKAYAAWLQTRTEGATAHG